MAAVIITVGAVLAAWFVFFKKGGVIELPRSVQEQVSLELEAFQPFQLNSFALSGIDEYGLGRLVSEAKLFLRDGFSESLFENIFLDSN